MKVLHFVPGSGVGGIERFVMDITSASRKNIDYSFIVFARKETDFVSCIKQRGIVHVCSGWSFSTLKKTFQLMKKNHYDVVHAHLGCWSFIVLLIAKMCRVNKRIAHSHSADAFGNMNSVGKIVYCLSKIYNPFCVTDYMACSDHACECTFGKKVAHSSKYTKVLNPVDFNRMTKMNGLTGQALRRELGLRSNSKVVCNVGYLGKHKNQAFLLQLAGKDEMLNTDFLLVGDGWNREKLEEMVRSKALMNVYFAGVRNDISAILNMSDLFVLPSILEGLGTVVLEAQACGTPCIISENVTMETDVGLGLVQQIPLINEDAWVRAINDSEKKAISPETIIGEFSKKNITIDKCIELIETVYEGTVL